MSTPEEIAEERAKLIEVSEKARLAIEETKRLEAQALPDLRAQIELIREINDGPGMRALDAAMGPGYVRADVEGMVAQFVERMAAYVWVTRRELEDTWLGIQESIIALDETGEVPRSPGM